MIELNTSSALKKKMISSKKHTEKQMKHVRMVALCQWKASMKKSFISTQGNKENKPVGKLNLILSTSVQIKYQQSFTLIKFDGLEPQ